jgi:hypothetical protein
MARRRIRMGLIIFFGLYFLFLAYIFCFWLIFFVFGLYFRGDFYHLYILYIMSSHNLSVKLERDIIPIQPKKAKKPKKNQKASPKKK